MDEIVWAAAAAVVALVPPVRRRFVPVSKALLSAGLGIGTAALRGVEGVITAAACGERPAPNSVGSGTAPPAGRTGRSPAASTAPKRARA